MTKRIVSGIFILTALGALGVILAGALTSGDQLIVRFLTAVIVAALGLYVVSDLRLQADDDARAVRSTEAPWPAMVDAPPNSTAAFMATITRHSGPDLGDTRQGDEDSKSGTREIDFDPDGPAEDERVAPHAVGVGTTSSSTSEHTESAVVEDAGSLGGPPQPSLIGSSPVTVRAVDLTDLSGLGAHGLTSEVGIGEDADVPAPVGEFGTRPGGDEWPSAAPLVTLADVDQAPLPRPAPLNGETSNGFGGGFTDDSLPATEAEEPASDVAVAEFEYSGEVDVPDVQWPAAPEGTDESAGDAAGSEPAETSDTHASLDLDLDLGLDFDFDFDFDADRVGGDEASMADTDSNVDSDAARGDVSAVVSSIDTRSGFEPPEVEVSRDLAPEDDGPETEADSAVSAIDLPAEPAPLDTDTAAGSDVAAGEFQSFIGQNGVQRPLPSPFVDHSSLSAAEYADAPLAPIIDLRDVAPTTESSIDSAISAGEVEVITALIEQGMLSTDGPISDRDVRTMVYVAFTSNELRKLILAGGNPDGPTPEFDLGPVELFSRGITAPQTLYPGLPVQSEARSQLG